MSVQTTPHPLQSLRIQCLTLQIVAESLNEQVFKIYNDKNYEMIPNVFILEYNAKLILRPFENEIETEIAKIKETYLGFKKELIFRLAKRVNIGQTKIYAKIPKHAQQTHIFAKRFGVLIIRIIRSKIVCFWFDWFKIFCKNAGVKILIMNSNLHPRRNTHENH